MDGVATGYYRNGKKCFQASYKKGVLNGDVIRYSENGEK
jgi:antitoxin component YwqK of YwqJK toxin-antitoxin module